MTARPKKNLVVSIHRRLLNNAKVTHRPFQAVLQYFAMERFLYRLSQSPHADQFVLKGALLFQAWNTADRRPTLDIDLLAFMDNAPENVAVIVRELCTLSVEPDGLEFLPALVTAFIPPHEIFVIHQCSGYPRQRCVAIRRKAWSRKKLRPWLIWGVSTAD